MKIKECELRYFKASVMYKHKEVRNKTEEETRQRRCDLEIALKFIKSTNLLHDKETRFLTIYDTRDNLKQ